MVISITEELTHPLPLLGIYSSVRPNHHYWAIASIQIALCITTSLFVSYIFISKLNFGKNSSWTNAVNSSNQIRKRLQNLEKEKAIWKFYLHWMEDYFYAYCHVLKFLNRATFDVDKIYKEEVLGLKQIASSLLGSESGGNVTKISGNQSESCLDSAASEDDLQLIANFAQVLAQMADGDSEKPKTDGAKPTYDQISLIASDVTSGDETNEESESVAVSLDEELNEVELKNIEHSNNENNLSNDDGLYPISDCSAGDCEGALLDVTFEMGY